VKSVITIGLLLSQHWQHLLPAIRHVYAELETISHCIVQVTPLSDINISQGSVATHLECGGIFNDRFIANLQDTVTVKKSGQQLVKHRHSQMGAWGLAPPLESQFNWKLTFMTFGIAESLKLIQSTDILKIKSLDIT